ncbi:MAG TPA: D-alanyl-D-alanine carboxypeptidase, partial [Firmicutes bacterium]|nr:D-alanyl-D-alanine carboxypeptidase [Bacillota bacterium]
SQIWLEPGEEMTVEDLMKAVGIVSANDASVALAEYIAGSHEEFVKLMNKR